MPTKEQKDDNVVAAKPKLTKTDEKWQKRDYYTCNEKTCVGYTNLKDKKGIIINKYVVCQKCNNTYHLNSECSR